MHILISRFPCVTQSVNWASAMTRPKHVPRWQPLSSPRLNLSYRSVALYYLYHYTDSRRLMASNRINQSTCLATSTSHERRRYLHGHLQTHSTRDALVSALSERNSYIRQPIKTCLHPQHLCVHRLYHQLSADGESPSSPTSSCTSYRSQIHHVPSA